MVPQGIFFYWCFNSNHSCNSQKVHISGFRYATKTCSYHSETKSPCLLLGYLHLNPIDKNNCDEQEDANKYIVFFYKGTASSFQEKVNRQLMIQELHNITECTMGINFDSWNGRIVVSTINFSRYICIIYSFLLGHQIHQKIFNATV